MILAAVRHVVQAFGVSLDELHNDSTTISFHGAYADATSERTLQDPPTPAITWGHSKAHRPDPAGVTTLAGPELAAGAEVMAAEDALLDGAEGVATTAVTELTALQRQVLRLLQLPTTTYGA